MDEDKLRDVRLLDTFIHFAAKRFRWSPPDIRETWDNEFFSCVLLEEKAIEEERKEYEKDKKKGGHSGGSMPKASKAGSTINPVDIGESSAPPEDKSVLDWFNRARAEEE